MSPVVGRPGQEGNMAGVYYGFLIVTEQGLVERVEGKSENGRESTDYCDVAANN